MRSRMIYERKHRFFPAPKLSEFSIHWTWVRVHVIPVKSNNLRPVRPSFTTAAIDDHNLRSLPFNKLFETVKTALNDPISVFRFRPEIWQLRPFFIKPFLSTRRWQG